MKSKSALISLSVLVAYLSGCVQVDKEVAQTPTVYWKAPKDAIPTKVIEPEQIKTDKILSSDSESSNKKSDSEKPVPAAEKMLRGEVLDLSEILDIALENNTQTRIYWFQAKSYAASLGKANSAYYPQVAVGADIARSKNKSSFGSIPIGAYYMTAYGPSAQINWLLYDFGQREAKVEAAREALRAANFEFNQTIQDVALSINTSYYNLYQAMGSVKAAKMDIADAKTAYESAKAKLDSGVGNKQDMLNALANFRNSEYVLETANAQLESARAQLANAMGIKVSADLKISENVKLPSDSQTSQKIDDLIAQAMRSRQTLLAGYAQLRQSQAQIKVAERNFLPTLNASGSASYEWCSDGTYGDSYALQGGLSVSWTIFEGFSRKYDLINAKVQERAKAQQLKASEITIISNVWTYYHAYQSALKQVASSQAAVEANQEAYSATKIGYDNGVNTINDLLNAQYRLATARQQKVSADATLCTSIAQLAHATGALMANTAEEMPQGIEVSK